MSSIGVPVVNSSSGIMLPSLSPILLGLLGRPNLVSTLISSSLKPSALAVDL